MKKEIIIQGPCNIKILEGEAKIIGIRLEKGQSIQINSNRTYTLIYNDNTKLEMNCKKLLDNLDLNWDKTAEELSESGGVILLLGSIDSGKTYLANLFANLATPNIKIIDADVGQSTLYLPSFVAELRPNRKSLILEELGYEKIDFFGDITPSTNPKLHVQKVLRLYETTPKEKLTVIDTDGWISGLKAMLHKFELIYSIDPDYIIIFDQKMKDTLPNNYRNRAIFFKSVNLHKSKSDRKNNRITKYKKYFSSAKRITIPSENLIGRQITDILYSAWGDYIQLLQEEPCIGYYISLDLLKGALLGLVKNREIIGAGLLADLTSNELVILSEKEGFSGLLLGYISLNDKFEERRIRFRKCKS
ncbi:Clp1/GlmU family protein [Sulfolobus tengchongensis]|uniref:polynucleotide 5'-hydroxyl-kinase n=1 Tax=Sulfolobus tengchongensis TaxID=207809 RepID=A0AAX4L0P9_9CREN